MVDSNIMKVAIHVQNMGSLFVIMAAKLRKITCNLVASVDKNAASCCGIAAADLKPVWSYLI